MGMEEKYIQQFKKGAYEMILLSLIAQKETYGYEILTEIQKQGGEIFAFAKEGTIYPILYRLTKAGLIQYRLVPAKDRKSTRLNSSHPSSSRMPSSA